MAKAKKQENTEEQKPAAATAPAAKSKAKSAKEPAQAASAPARESAAAKKPAAKAAKGKAKPAPATTAQPLVPLIDTSLAAQTAAKLVAHREAIEGHLNQENRPQESSSFKQLKESLNKPASHAPSAFLHSTAPHKKLNLPFGGLNQVGKGQTFGADVNRSGVPRRTGG